VRKPCHFSGNLGARAVARIVARTKMVDHDNADKPAARDY
jgi:hypothetical protein